MGSIVQVTGKPRPRSRVLIELTFVAAVYLLCLARLAGLVVDFAVNLLFEDQWDFMQPLFDGAGPWAAFAWQHGPHRQGLWGLISWYLYGASSWDVRAEAWVGVVALAAAALAGILINVRLRGRLKWADAVFPLIVMSPVHWETLLLTPNLAHGILPLLLVIILTHVWMAGNSWLRAGGIVLMTGLCLFTGFAFCAACVSVGLMLMHVLRERVGRTHMMAALGGILCIGIVFGINYKWSPAVPGWRFPVPNWWDYPRFASLMFSSLVGWRDISVGAVLLGGTLLALVAFTFLWSARAILARDISSRITAIWVLTGTSLVFIAFTAIGRLPVSLEAAFMWRYLPLMCPGICGLVIAAETWAASRDIKLQISVMTLQFLLAGAIWANFVPEHHAAAVAKAKHAWIEGYLETHSLTEANRRSEFSVYQNDPDSQVIADRLRWLERHRLSFFSTDEADGKGGAPGETHQP